MISTKFVILTTLENAQTTLFLNSNSLKIIESLKLSSLEQGQSKTFF